MRETANVLSLFLSDTGKQMISPSPTVAPTSPPLIAPHRVQTANSRVLSDADLEHFYQNGFVLVRECFTREQAQPWIDLAWKRLDYDAADRSTWSDPRVGMPAMHEVSVPDFAPKAWSAICELMGGAHRVQQPAKWGDSFIINFGVRAEQPWTPPTAESPGWHKDGDWFRHYLDSPEQGLLEVIFWSDVLPHSGGTAVAFDSVGPVARRLAAHPEGLNPNELGTKELAHECQRFGELTGNLGDVALIHPYLLHATYANPSGRPRFITNTPMSFAQPMRFDDPDKLCPVEIAVLRGLGVDSYDFQAQGPRQNFGAGHARAERHAQMLREHQERLEGDADYQRLLESSSWQAVSENGGNP